MRENSFLRERRFRESYLTAMFPIFNFNLLQPVVTIIIMNALIKKVSVSTTRRLEAPFNLLFAARMGSDTVYITGV